MQGQDREERRGHASLHCHRQGGAVQGPDRPPRYVAALPTPSSALQHGGVLSERRTFDHGVARVICGPGRGLTHLPPRALSPNCTAPVGIYEVSGEPTVEVAEHGTRAAVESKCDVVVAIGGGKCAILPSSPPPFALSSPSYPKLALLVERFSLPLLQSWVTMRTCATGCFGTLIVCCLQSNWSYMHIPPSASISQAPPLTSARSLLRS